MSRSPGYYASGLAQAAVPLGAPAIDSAPPPPSPLKSRSGVVIKIFRSAPGALGMKSRVSTIVESTA
eukprot:6203089-Pleurochrysis_carterae.AAC.2